MRSPKNVIYIATAARYENDSEWDARLQKHRDRRPPEWQTQEVPIELTKAISELEANNHQNNLEAYILIDSLGTWLANLLEQPEEIWQQTEQELLIAIQNCRLDITFVSEEVGWGIVPAYALGRQFRDRLGSLSRKIGAIADVVYLVTGGHAVNLSLIGEKLPPS
jgi:adenosylcobinamide kinase/adenosylcobinamide-phosphate guanylyltransferase